jgi:hypothetical protein
VSAQPPQWSQQQWPQQPPQRPSSPPQRPARRANGTDRPPASQSRGRITLAVAASVVLLVTASSLVTWAALAAAKERSRLAAQPSPTPYSLPKSADQLPPGQENVLAKLPDLCPKLETALPADLRRGSAEHSKVNDDKRQNCLWVEKNGEKSVTWVKIEVILYPDRDPETAIATASQELAKERDYAADTESNGGFHKNVRDVTGIGDEAFGDEMTNSVIWTVEDEDGKEEKFNYHVGGANLGVRSGNATIEVAYLGATYPESQNVKELRGTNVTYAQAEPKVKQIVETIIEQLK